MVESSRWTPYSCLYVATHELLFGNTSELGVRNSDAMGRPACMRAAPDALCKSMFGGQGKVPVWHFSLQGSLGREWSGHGPESASAKKQGVSSVRRPSGGPSGPADPVVADWVRSRAGAAQAPRPRASEWQQGGRARKVLQAGSSDRVPAVQRQPHGGVSCGGGTGGFRSVARGRWRNAARRERREQDAVCSDCRVWQAASGQ